jgi:asparagine synthase (glutamine-hydrolysing)
MCGINFINKKEKNKIELMNKALSHRGPDQEDTFIDSKVSIGHVRLSILDPSEKGKQPMAYKNLVIAYNGEIYNFKELQDFLIQKGFVFNSQTDTEVILKGYAHEGKKFLEKLNGIFAFLIYNKKNHKVLLMRDRLGIKPLYYFKENNDLIVSSEIKAIFNCTGGKKSFIKDEYAIADYLNHETIKHESLFKNIKAVEPGQALYYDLNSNQIKTEKIIDLFDSIDKQKFLENERKSEKQLIEELDAILNRVVKRQLISDVPIGTICSGGIDSSLVTAIAKKHKQDIDIYNVKVDDPNLDESAYAKKVARHIGAEIQTEILDKKKFQKFLAKCIYHNDFPLTHSNSVGIFLVNKKARKDGIPVLLSGEGADEVFGGYSYYNSLYAMLKLQSNKILRLILKRINPNMLLESRSQIIRSYITSKKISQINCDITEFNRIQEKYSFIKNQNERLMLAFIAHDLKNYIIPILRRSDRMSMMAGVELRVPFLDNEIIDFCLNLPLRYKLRKSTAKYLLKKVAERYLPKDIIYRPKCGFALPAQAWISNNNPKLAYYKLWKKYYNTEEPSQKDKIYEKENNNP